MKFFKTFSKPRTVLRQRCSPLASSAPCGTRFEKVLKNLISLFIFVIVTAGTKGQAQGLEKLFRSMSVGAELGGSIDFMVTDSETHANGMGLGSHWGFYTVTNRKNSDWNFKFRLESVGLHEESWSNSAVKSLEQDWFMIGLGVENRTVNKSSTFYWEASLGYGIGGTSDTFSTASAVDLTVVKEEVETQSSFFLSAGMGFKKRYQNRFSILASLRTFFMFGQPYDMPDRSFYPIPLMFSLGTEYQL